LAKKAAIAKKKTFENQIIKNMNNKSIVKCEGVQNIGSVILVPRVLVFYLKIINMYVLNLAQKDNNHMEINLRMNLKKINNKFTVKRGRVNAF